jgi:hypothetical protein
MNPFIKKPVTQSELIKWKTNPGLNPRTNRKISEKGEIYKYLKTKYNAEFPELPPVKNLKKINKFKKENIINSTQQDIKIEDKNNLSNVVEEKIIELNYSLNDVIDDKDPISLTLFWIEEDGKRKIVYPDVSALIFYKDSHNLIRCFERESLEYLKAHNINKHPITMDDIPDEVFKKIDAKDLEEEKQLKTVNDIALEIFQKFSTLSIFIDSEWFTNLDKEKLIKFNYEIGDMYKQNFSSSQLKEISKRVLFSKSSSELEVMSIQEAQSYLLQDMDDLLNVKKEELKYMCNYLLVGSLSVVIPDIRELYPDFCFSFSI